MGWAVTRISSPGADDSDPLFFFSVGGSLSAPGAGARGEGPGDPRVEDVPETISRDQPPPSITSMDLMGRSLITRYRTSSTLTASSRHVGYLFFLVLQDFVLLFVGGHKILREQEKKEILTRHVSDQEVERLLTAVPEIYYLESCHRPDQSLKSRKY